MGKPDGPYRFIPEFGAEVPTFIDKREDLIPPRSQGFKRLDYHVPFNKRGEFKPQWLDPQYYAQYGRQFRIDHEGYVMCLGQKVWDGRNGKKLETPTTCGNRAVNRVCFCRNHGGALHPADKRISAQNLSITKIEPERIEALDRVQKFMAGIITTADLEDDEVIGAYVRNNEGRPINSRVIGAKFQQQIVQELIKRMNSFMQMKLPNMIKAMTDIAESDFAEPADRIKAAQWVAERVIGKTPEILAISVSDKPVDQILGQLQGGSREEYRKSIQSSRVIEGVVDVPVVDVEADLEPDDFTVEGSNGNHVEDGRDSARPMDTDEVSLSVPDAGGSNGVVRPGSNTGVAVIDKAIATRDKAKEVKRRIKIDKNRRFAMRAQGVKMSGDLGWLIDYKAVKRRGTGEIIAYRATLVSPEDQTEAKLAKMALNSDNDPVLMGEQSA